MIMSPRAVVCAFALALLQLLVAPASAKTPSVKVPPPRPAGNGGTIGEIPINYWNAKKRTGFYYLPKGWKNKRIPMLVGLHGSGGDGNSIVGAFQGLADKYGFAIVGPTSHNPKGWLAPQSTTATWTEDFYHIRACYNYVRAKKGFMLNRSRIATVGFSAGGFSAGQIATSVSIFTHGMAVHSAMYTYRLGKTGAKNLWFSTGKNDGPFPPSVVKYYADDARAYGYKVKYSTWPGGHDLGNKKELEAAVRWWLGKS